ncbi:DegT/DnrJ/EryC1/StrS family aminotransferase [Candidatus Pelagibacter sp.]|nr:DegT/DnrJ/EryC1/StrS family aminotransferase [Candidatus Pelagibacter sp.]
MEDFFFRISNKKYLNLFSRATTGIYCLLKIIDQKNKSFIFPSTICASPIYASIFSKTDIIFCDVNPKDGNIDISKLKKILKTKKNIFGIFAPNMYGNPCELNIIKQISKKNSLFFIEDCAQSLGSKFRNKYTGYYGDASIFSFGYSKNIDVGDGGLILSNDKNLSKEINKFYEKQIFKKINKENLNFEYKKKYFQYHKSKFKKGFLKFIDINKYKFLFLRKENLKWFKNLKTKIQKFNHIKKENKLKFNLYKKILGNKFNFMNIGKDTYPWRFNFFINRSQRDTKLNLIWKNYGHANKLYPSIPKFLFGKKERFLGSEKIEKTIINLPLNEKMSKKDIINNANLVMKIFENENSYNSSKIR